MRWSSLARQDVTFIDDRLRDSESDLLFAVRRKTDGAPAWLYVLLEHQSKPDPWLRLRLLKYSVRIWERDRRRHPDDKLLRPIMPLVLYQGRYRWREPAEFSALFAEAVRAWPGVPRYAHLLIDQTTVAPEQLRCWLRTGRVGRSSSGWYPLLLQSWGGQGESRTCGRSSCTLRPPRGRQSAASASRARYGGRYREVKN